MCGTKFTFCQLVERHEAARNFLFLTFPKWHEMKKSVQEEGILPFESKEAFCLSFLLQLSSLFISFHFILAAFQLMRTTDRLDPPCTSHIHILIHSHQYTTNVWELQFAVPFFLRFLSLLFREAKPMAGWSVGPVKMLRTLCPISIYPKKSLKGFINLTLFLAPSIHSILLFSLFIHPSTHPVVYMTSPLLLALSNFILNNLMKHLTDT